MDNPEVKALIEAKLEQAKTDQRVSAYKAKVAAEAAGVAQDLADWERAMQGIQAGGWTSCGVAVEMMRRQRQVVEQIVIVTDEGENRRPNFVPALVEYRQELGVDPHVVFVKTQGAL